MWGGIEMSEYCNCEDVEWDTEVKDGIDCLYYVGKCERHGRVLQVFTWDSSDGFLVEEESK